MGNEYKDVALKSGREQIKKHLEHVFCAAE